MPAALRIIKPLGVECFYVHQAKAISFGYAVLRAEWLINDEPFSVLLADNLLGDEVPVIRKMLIKLNLMKGNFPCH